MAAWAAIGRLSRRAGGGRGLLEDVLRRTEERLQTVIEGAHGIIYIAEPGPEGRFIYVSPQIEQILGFTVAEWLADPMLWANQLHPEDRERTLEEEGQQAADTPGRLHLSEYRMLTRGGDARWIRDAATLVATADGELIWSGVFTDITEQRLTQAELEASEARFRTVIETASDAFVGMNEQGQIVEWNRKAEDVFGWSREEAIGRQLDETIIPERYRPSHRRGFEQFLRTGYGPVLGRTVELSALTRAGHEFPIELNIWAAPVHGELRISAFIRDITERKALEAVTHQAFHDPLTDLPNRVLFTDRVEQALSRWTAAQHDGVAVLILDLDDFKTVNDNLGHVAGDQLLIEVAARLRSCLRPGDTLARLAGDEFAILIEDLGSESAATAVAQRIRGALERPVEIQGMEIFVRASVGIAVGRDAETGPESLISDADVALYAAKSRGKSGFEVFEPAMRAAVVNKLELKTDLRRALEREELVVEYQPCIRLSDFAIVGGEALVRWSHRDRGLVMPADFIPLAEESGLIVPIGRWVIEHACRTAAGWLARVPAVGSLTLRVNLSARQLQDPRLVDDVAEALSASGLPADQLMLEITESSLVEDPEHVVARLGALRELGIRIAIDDFGTGYSSLSYLQRFPIDLLKVDMSFVNGLGRGAGESAMAVAIVQLAQNLGIETLAEGVERPEQVSALRTLQCGYAQGFHFSPPVSANEFEAMLLDEAATALPPPRRIASR